LTILTPLRENTIANIVGGCSGFASFAPFALMCFSVSMSRFRCKCAALRADIGGIGGWILFDL
jgi:hypothetical protein